MSEHIASPSHYTTGKFETIDKIDRVIEGLPAKDAYMMGQILRYFDRCEHKHDDPEMDLAKASNYAHRLVTGKWKY